MSETDNPSGEAQRYPQIVRVVRETPWAILPGTLATILDVVGQRLAGERFSEEEIKARVGGRSASRPTQVAGSVAIIPIYGAIIPKATLFSEMSGGTSIASLQEDFRAALADETVKSIVLDIDSPGGMTDMVPEFAAELRAARGDKPIVAVANTRAASAAYWLGSQADELVATPSGDVGSIGVFAAHDDMSAMQEKLGVKTTLISAGKFKTEGNPFEPLSDEARAEIQDRVDEMYDVFTSDVAKARGVSVETVKNGYGEGRMLSAAKAVKAGMADRVDTLEAVVSRLQNPSGRRRVANGSGAGGAQTVTVSVTGDASSFGVTAVGADTTQDPQTFSDDVDEALRALEAVVSRAEALRALTGTKREQIAALVERAQELLAHDQEEAQDEPADEGEIAFAVAAADSRLRGL